MNNFKQIAEDILAGKLSGTFVLRDGTKISSSELIRNNCIIGPYDKYKYPYKLIDRLIYSFTDKGFYISHNSPSSSDVIDFIPDDMKEVKEIKIEVPEGYEVDKENSTFEKIVFKPIKDNKPKSWEEYCELMRDKSEVGHSINASAYIDESYWRGMTTPDYWRTTLPSEELAKAFIAMMQLMSLRKAWVGEWEPDWTDISIKYVIECNSMIIYLNAYCHNSNPISFPTQEMAEEFLKCFKDLIENAKELI